MSDGDGIRCPKCGRTTEVVQTRQIRDGIERRRRCSSRCGGYRSTVEREPSGPTDIYVEKLHGCLAALAGIMLRYRQAIRQLGWGDPEGLNERIDEARRLVSERE